VLSRGSLQVSKLAVKGSDWAVDHFFFRLGCRPFFDLDGCNLRSKYLGILLSATALDENNGLFPVVFVAVESE